MTTATHIIATANITANTTANATTTAATNANAGFGAIAMAALAGAILIFFAGFTQASVFHNTAHDTRHAIAFPCH